MENNQNEIPNELLENLRDAEGGDVEVDRKTGKIIPRRYRDLGKVAKPLFAALTVVGLFFSIHEIFRLNLVSYTESLYYYAILGIFLPPAFLIYPATKAASRDKIPWYDVLFFLLSMIFCGYYMVNAFRILVEGWVLAGPTLSTVISILMWGFVLEALRRAGGLTLSIFAGVISVYPLFAAHMPGFLEGTGWSFTDSARFHIMSRESVIGVPTRTFCELVIGFMVFSSTLSAVGGGLFFTKFASSLFGWVRGGPAKISVVASGLFGTISGSAVSNVAVDGWITIPTMKKTGYTAEYASAIEACASTGGAIMPPVMGAVAFVMASFLQIPYLQVAIAAAVPACLYYWGLFVGIDAYAAKKGLAGLPRVQLPSLKETFRDGWVYFGAIVALITLLFQMKQEAQAPYVASALLLVGAMFRKDIRPNLKTIYNLLLDSGKVMVDMIAILAGIGFILGGMTMTGLSISFSSELVNLFGQHPFIMLVMGMIVSYILGMGMTITACYIILALILVPALTPLGFDIMAVHLFVLYCGLFSFITPPVALAAYVAAVIGGANFWKTGWVAMRLSFVMYLVPFFFVYDPNLILHGDNILVTVLTVMKSFLGVWIIGSGIEGYLCGAGTLRTVNRVIYLIAGLALFVPGVWTDLGGLVLFLIMFGVDLLKRRNKKIVTPQLTQID